MTSLGPFYNKPNSVVFRHSPIYEWKNSPSKTYSGCNNQALHFNWMSRLLLRLSHKIFLLTPSGYVSWSNFQPIAMHAAGDVSQPCDRPRWDLDISWYEIVTFTKAVGLLDNNLYSPVRRNCIQQPMAQIHARWFVSLRWFPSKRT